MIWTFFQKIPKWKDYADQLFIQICATSAANRWRKCVGLSCGRFSEMDVEKFVSMKLINHSFCHVFLIRQICSTGEIFKSRVDSIEDNSLVWSRISMKHILFDSWNDALFKIFWV